MRRGGGHISLPHTRDEIACLFRGVLRTPTPQVINEQPLTFHVGCSDARSPDDYLLGSREAGAHAVKVTSSGTVTDSVRGR